MKNHHLRQASPGKRIGLKKFRRAMSTVEVALALGLIAVVVSTGGYYLSSNTSSELTETADGIADPAQLAQKFLP